MYCLIGVDSDVLVVETDSGIESQLREDDATNLNLNPIFFAKYTLQPAEAETLTLGYLNFLRIGCALRVPQHAMNKLVGQISSLQWPEPLILQAAGL